MTKTHQCARCGYTTNIIACYKKHLERKFKCKPVLKDIPIDLLKEALQDQGIKKELSNSSDNINSNIITCTQGYIYLLREREFIKTKESIYKVGKTTKDLFKRFSQYPKQSELLLGIRVLDCHVFETELLKIMRKDFKSRRDIGAEYFEGNEHDIKLVISDLLKIYN